MDDRGRSYAIASVALGASSVAFLLVGAFLLLVRDQALIGGVLLAVAVGDALFAAFLMRRRG